MRCVKLRNFLGFCLTWTVGYDMKVIFRQLQANKLFLIVYLRKERLLFNILPKSQNRHLTLPTPIFRSSSKQPEGTSDSFRGGRSQIMSKSRNFKGVQDIIMTLAIKRKLTKFIHPSSRTHQLTQTCKARAHCQQYVHLNTVLCSLL